MKKGHLILGVVLLIVLSGVLPAEVAGIGCGTDDPQYMDCSIFNEKECIDKCNACMDAMNDFYRCRDDSDCANSPTIGTTRRWCDAACSNFMGVLGKCTVSTPTLSGGTGTGDAVCGNGVCETDKGESCANCLSDCPCSSGEACQPSDSNADAFGCVIVAVPKGMALTVSTVKDTYSPGEMMIVMGSAWDANTGDPIEGAKVVIDVEGIGGAWTLVVDEPTNYLGDYRGEFQLPPGIPQGTYTVTVTASKGGYPDKSDTTSITIGGQGLDVDMDIAKEHYDIGETTYCTISVWNVTADPVSDANLKIIVTHLESGKSTEYSGVTNADGQYIGSFTWSDGHEGTWLIEVTASKEVYRDGYDKKSITVGGEFKVNLETDKEVYNPGDEIKIKIKVISPEKDETCTSVDINTYDSEGALYDNMRDSGRANGEYEHTVKIDDATMVGGKWRIEVIAIKQGYPDANAKKEIEVKLCKCKLNGTLRVNQDFAIPQIAVKNPIGTTNQPVGYATQIIWLNLKIDAPASVECQGKKYPIDLNKKIRVKFDIDYPSSIMGPKEVVTDKNGIASTRIEFTKDIDNVIQAHAYYPAELVLLENGEFQPYGAAEATLDIKPICSYGDSMWFGGKVVNDITTDPDELKKDFARVINDYGRDKVTTTKYPSLRLLWFLAHPGGEAGGIKVTYYTGKEKELLLYIDGIKDKKISSGELFQKSLELNHGDITDALLTCHTALRHAAPNRGRETFPVELSAKEKAIIKRWGGFRKPDMVAYEKEIGKEAYNKERTRYMELTKQLNYLAPEGIFNKLEQLRPTGDNVGAWYHLFGTATFALSYTSTYPYAVDTLPHAMLLRLKEETNKELLWAEEYLVSGDRYSDPNEYCIDHYGRELGNFLRGNPKGANMWSISKDPNDVYSIRLKCPMSIKVADNRLGEYFKLDQETWEIEGSLPARFILLPDEETETFGVLVMVKNSDFDIELEAVEDGKFSFYTYDFTNRAGANYGDIKVKTGDAFSVSTEIGDIDKPIIKSDGAEILPNIDYTSEEEEEEIRKEAREYYIKINNMEINNPPTASFSIMPQNPKTSDTIVVASTSSDPDGDTLTYSWYRDGSEMGNSPNWEWENPQAGEHTIKLVVEDGKGGRDECSRKITVIGPTPTVIPGFEIGIGTGDKTNNPPIASFYIMPQNPKTSDTIVVASTSFDPDDDKLTYSWYRDGIYLTEIGDWSDWEWENPQAGEHTIKLVVDDGKGGSDEDSMKIKVIGPTPTDIPGFEIALLIGAIVVALIIIKRRKHNI